MLDALGVETSKTFSVIETGEALHRGDEPSPTRSAVLVRLSHSHIRIGTFQRLATIGDAAAIQRLVDYALPRYFGEAPGEDGAARLFGHVVARTARLAASYMAAGFVHGVLNSDNINITGESFDYGPWRWTPHFDPDFTAAYFDQNGLYAFGRQAEAIHWDVMQLGIALTAVAPQEPLVEAINGFGDLYQAALVERMLWRLGVIPLGDARDGLLVAAIEQGLRSQQVTIDRFFFDWAGGTLRSPSQAYDDVAFGPFRAQIGAYAASRSLTHPYWQSDTPCSMHIEEVEAIWKPIADMDDWTMFEQKLRDIIAMADALGTK
jgi:serine/tyrosine/threonine adenylyltransferase